MKIVKKKIAPCFYDEVKRGNKNYEIRKDDDNVEVGDILMLREYDMQYGYTGRYVFRLVSHVLRSTAYGLQPGYVIYSWR